MGGAQQRLVLLLFLVTACSQAAWGQRLLVKHDPFVTEYLLQQARQAGLSVHGQARGFLVLSVQGEAGPKSSIKGGSTALHGAEAGVRPSMGGPAAGSGQLAAGGAVAGAAPAAAAVQQTLDLLRTWAGVQHAELDQPRFLQPATSARDVLQGPGAGSDCSARDAPATPGALLPEYVPYGIPQIQADSKRLPSATDKAGVMICVIDSGVDASHQDLSPNSLDGCKYEDAFAPGGCPFLWSQDMISHGTHVVGTISARRNGEGVVGIIPDGAEVYMVRVFNDSGDVNQGQGLVYGSSLILAYTACEGRLAALKSLEPTRQYRMVVSMSLGAPGPLTIEQLFFREAGKRGDVIFVGSSGNNGTTPTLGQDGKLTAAINPGNFPGTYPEVIGVSAVDCNNRLAPFSQKHPSVDIAAPGVDILSTGSRYVPSKAGLVRSAFRIDSGGPAKFMVHNGIAGASSQIRFSATGKASGKVADCGDGSKPCPAARDGICLVQWDPGMSGGSSGAAQSTSSSSGTKAATTATVAPAATAAAATAATRGSVGRRLLRWLTVAQQQAPRGGAPTGLPKPPSQAAPARGAPPTAATLPAGAVQQVPGSTPTRFTCELMEFCIKQGAKAALFAAPSLSSGYYPDWAWAPSGPDGQPELLGWPFFANLKCTVFNCSCWGRLSGQNILPAAGLTLRQYGELQAALKGGRDVRGTVEAQPDLYQRLSGTSMAVPHVSAALARIWAEFPGCPSDVVRKSIEVTARDLGPPGKDPMFGHGLLQAESAYDWLSKQECAQQKAVGQGQQQPDAPPKQGQQQQQQPQKKQEQQQQQPKTPQKQEQPKAPPKQQAEGQQQQQQQQQQPAGGGSNGPSPRRLVGIGGTGTTLRTARHSGLPGRAARPEAGWRQAMGESQQLQDTRQR